MNLLPGEVPPAGQSNKVLELSKLHYMIVAFDTAAVCESGTGIALFATQRDSPASWQDAMQLQDTT